MIVDAHLHVWNRFDGKIGNQLPVLPLRGGMIQIGDRELLGMPAYLLDCCALADYVVSEFNAAGVDIGVVVQDYMDGVQNDYLLEVLATFPGRFFAHALPNYWNTDHVAQEVEDIFRRGFRGLKLPADHLLGTIRLDDPRLMQIWGRMEESERVLAIDLSEGQEQVAETENILQSFPKLHVAMGHFGMVNRGGWPGQLLLARHENVYMETGGIVWLYRHEGFPFPDALEAILRAKQEVGIGLAADDDRLHLPAEPRFYPKSCRVDGGGKETVAGRQRPPALSAPRARTPSAAGPTYYRGMIAYEQ